MSETSDQIETKAATGASSVAQKEPPVPKPRSALGEYLSNFQKLPSTLRSSIVRHAPADTDRGRSDTVMQNFFLHIMPAKLQVRSLRFPTTLGLGVVLLVLFALLCVTGVLLMVYYKPSVADAYSSTKDLIFVVPSGRFIRNIHRWGAHGMVACVLLHMARVFYTAAYKAPREFNWVLGMGLFVLTLGLSFTGYLLPWDQLAYWAITIGSNIAQSPREITDVLGITASFDPGGFQKEVLLGAHYVGQEALTRFYVLHVMVLPAAACVLMGVHLWRIRKDGGLARPGERVPPRPVGKGSSGTPSTRTWGLMALVKGRTPAVGIEMSKTVPTYPNGVYAVAALTMVTVAVTLLLGYLFDAPLVEIANPGVPENPAKAPWYFLGLQELVSYSAFMGGIGIPSIVVIGLTLIPYLDRENERRGVWFSGPLGRRTTWKTALYATFVTVGVLAFTVRYGWLRNWYPDISQLVIVAVNPGTLLVVLFAGWSLVCMRRTRSTRQGAIALFTCFLVAFAILTYFATVHRGPNWDFYWWPSQWPVH